MRFLPEPLKILSMFLIFGTIIFVAYLTTTFVLTFYIVGSPDGLPPLLHQAWVLSCYLIPGVIAYKLARRFH
jgi:hypothetical protein